MACTVGESDGSIPACAGEPTHRTTRPFLTAVYPRVCGGALHPMQPHLSHHGLSPRVRGSLPPGSVPIHRVEVYPRVCGGASAVSSVTWTSTGLSPRVRGSLDQQESGQTPCGLSPRVRGSRRDVQLVHGLSGSIPACAGEPRSTGIGSGLHAVYPRVCGGAPATVTVTVWVVGLSPRVRGSPRYRHRHRLGCRSIPACAGEPVSSVSPS